MILIGLHVVLILGFVILREYQKTGIIYTAVVGIKRKKLCTFSPTGTGMVEKEKLRLFLFIPTIIVPNYL